MIYFLKEIPNRFLAGVIAVGLAGAAALAGVSQVPVARPLPAPSAPPRPVAVPRFVVLLDAAHGGDDNGGQVGETGSGATAEKTVTLALSVRLRSLLTARGFQVVTTREGNVSLDSVARAQIANHISSGTGAAACLSLHASEAGTGVHIFVSSLAPANQVRFLAWKTAQAAFVSRSLKLAGTVNSAFEHSSVNGGGNGASDAGPISVTLGRASLPGVDSMACPAIAIEFAPIRGTDRKVVTEVTDPQYQTEIVEALAAAMLQWKTDWETDRQLDPAHGGGKLP